MWLRDFLPEHEKLKNSRIMTFGYDSDVTDRSTVMELENWAESLLRSLDEVRTGDEVSWITLWKRTLSKRLADCVDVGEKKTTITRLPFSGRTSWTEGILYSEEWILSDSP
jgi:hypothetical protein